MTRHVAEIRRALQPLFERADVRLVVLFGSVATARARAHSDIDLGLLCDSTCTADIAPFVMQLLGTERFDLVDLRRAPPLLAMAVVKTGRVLHQDPPSTFASFASLTLRRYEDCAKLRRARQAGIKNFLQERGL